MYVQGRLICNNGITHTLLKGSDFPQAMTQDEQSGEEDIYKRNNNQIFQYYFEKTIGYAAKSNMALKRNVKTGICVTNLFTIRFNLLFPDKIDNEKEDV